MQKSITPAPEGLRLLVGVNEGFRAIGIGRTKGYELLRQNKLKSVSIGGRRLLRISDLEKFVEEATRNAE